MLRGGRVPIAFNCASSRRLVDQKGDFALFEAEVDEAIALVHCVAAEALAQENVPVWLPALVHVFLHDLCDLDSLLLEVVGLEGVLGHHNSVLEHIIWHICRPVYLGSLDSGTSPDSTCY